MIDPIAIRDCFGIQGLDIHWYGIIICLGIILGVTVGVILARKKGYNAEMVMDLMLIALPLAIVCARIYYVVFEWQQYADNFWRVFAIWEGGIAIYGGVIGAVIGAAIFCKWRKVHFGDVLDIGAPGLILGQAIGRWGNFVNQEAFGEAITDPAQQWFPLGVDIQRAHQVFDPDLAQWVPCAENWHYATFFYESVWNFIVFAVLLIYFKKAKHKGNVFVLYLVLYGFGRFFIEGMRTDSLWLIPGVIRISQLLAAIMVIGGIIYLAIRHRQEPTVWVYEGRYSIAGATIAAQTQEDKAETSEEGQNDDSEAAGEESEAQKENEDKSMAEREKQTDDPVEGEDAPCDIDQQIQEQTQEHGEKKTTEEGDEQ